jgi:hypothetical protein
MNFGAERGQKGQGMASPDRNPVVHLELHTNDLPNARRFYAELCEWRSEQIEVAGGSYLALEMRGGIADFGGGIVECETRRPLWLPYVEVAEISGVTERARGLGAQVLLEPREGPAGWRSVVAAPAGGEIAFWEPKDRRRSVSGPRSVCTDNPTRQGGNGCRRIR